MGNSDGVIDASVHERGLLRFVAPRRRRRVSVLLGDAKRRDRLREELRHFSGLDERYAIPLDGTDRLQQSILSALKKRGAPGFCYAVSHDLDVDGQILPLEDALTTTVARTGGTFLSCLAGELAYFEDEDGRWILVRPPDASNRDAR